MSVQSNQFQEMVRIAYHLINNTPQEIDPPIKEMIVPRDCETCGKVTQHRSWVTGLFENLTCEKCETYRAYKIG